MNFTNLTKFIDSLPAYGIPSSDIIVYRDHKEIYRHTVGVRDTETGESLRGDELYFLYSCTKVVTVVAALQLFEQGKFLMRDPVSNVLPEFKNVRVKNGEDTVDVSTPITFRHLFTMTAGMSYNLKTAGLQEIGDLTNGCYPTRTAVRAMAKTPLDFHPGEHFQYSLCHDVLAAAVEVMSGMTFGEYVKKNIFEPCGMVDSTFIMTDAVKARMASQYRFNDKTHKADKIPLSNAYVLGGEYESGGAGLISSVNDYIKFVDALACGGVAATGKRILSRYTIDMMRTPCLNELQRTEYLKKWKCLDGYTYGFGVRTFIDKSAGTPVPHGEFGWHGAAGSYMIIDRENHLSLFYAQHMLNNKEAYVHPRIRQCVYGGFED